MAKDDMLYFIGYSTNYSQKNWTVTGKWNGKSTKEKNILWRHFGVIFGILL